MHAYLGHLKRLDRTDHCLLHCRRRSTLFPHSHPFYDCQSQSSPLSNNLSCFVMHTYYIYVWKYPHPPRFTTAAL